eukprot:COSAG02_NODE_24834_length_676_cov_1.077990_1_plen_59_part_00
MLSLILTYLMATTSDGTTSNSNSTDGTDDGTDGNTSDAESVLIEVSNEDEDDEVCSCS